MDKETAKKKLADAAGGGRGVRKGGTADDADRTPGQGQFEPEDVRRRKKPKDDLPQPQTIRPGSA